MARRRRGYGLPFLLMMMVSRSSLPSTPKPLRGAVAGVDSKAPLPLLPAISKKEHTRHPATPMHRAAHLTWPGAKGVEAANDGGAQTTTAGDSTTAVGGRFSALGVE